MWTKEPSKKFRKLQQKEINWGKKSFYFSRVCHYRFSCKMVFTNNNKLLLHSLISTFSLRTIMSHRNDTGLWQSTAQEPRPFHRSLEIQFSNPNWLTIRTKTELKVAKSIHQMGHFYPRILFSYREKSSDYQIMPFHTSYDMFTISYPTAASCHSQHALNNTWPKPNLHSLFRALVTRKTPMWCL